jgi:hypothetical protein
VFSIHPEFEDLPVTSQRNLLKTNVSLGLALIVVRSELLSGIEQIYEGLGDEDEKVWKENYSSVFDTPDKLMKVSIRDVGIFNSDQCTTFFSLLSVARLLCRNPTFFKLNLLIALTNPDKEMPGSSLSGLHNKYKMILKRRLSYNQDWVEGVSGNPEELIQKVFAAFESLKDIAEMNERILLSAPA